MDSQQTNPYATGSQGYAQLPEDESQSPNIPQNSQQKIIVQGTPAVGFPAHVGTPMSTFDISPQTRSPLEKLKTFPYQCYTYWLYLSIFGNAMIIFMALLTYVLLNSLFGWVEVFSQVFHGWQIFQCVMICIGVYKKNLEKISQGISSMRIYMVVSGIFFFIYVVSSWENITEKGPWRNPFCDSEECQKQGEFLTIVGLTVFAVICFALWFLVFLFPAIKIRNILRAAVSSQHSIPSPSINA